MSDQTNEARAMSRTQIMSIGAGLAIVAFILGYLVFAFWPDAKPDSTGAIPDSAHVLFGHQFIISSELRLILLVMVVGLVGSYIHALVSFVNFTGNRIIVRSWIWYYTVRPFVGAFLGLIFYYLLRGGLLSVNSSVQDINQYGILAVAGMTGLFSKQALDKLLDVFKELFKSSEGDKDKDKIGSVSLEISELIPDSLDKPTRLFVIGKGFLKESVVFINDVKRDIIYKNDNVITVDMAEDFKTKTELKLFVKNPNGETTHEQSLKIK